MGKRLDSASSRRRHLGLFQFYFIFLFFIFRLFTCTRIKGKRFATRTEASITKILLGGADCSQKGQYMMSRICYPTKK